MLISGGPRSPERRTRRFASRTRTDASGAAAPASARPGDEITAIKVDTRKLDSLVDMVGELVIVQSLIRRTRCLPVTSTSASPAISRS